MTTSTDIQVLLVILDEVKAIRQDNADFKAELKQDMQDFKQDVRKDMQDFKAEIRGDMSDFKAEVRGDMQTFKQDVNKQLDGVRSDLSGIHAEIKQLQTDSARVQSDLSWLLHIDYWLVSVMVGVFVLPHVLNSVTAIFKAIADGVREIARVFRKGGHSDN